MHHPHPEPPSRRTFLDWALHGLGAIFAVVLGVPVVGFLTDPRNRPKAPDDFRPVSGIKLSELPLNQPVQGTIRNVRRDAWTLYPDDVIGRVWVVRVRENCDHMECFKVFATTCPHLGCSINCNADQAAEPGFTCPCHNGRFALSGARVDPNPATRGMFALPYQVDAANPDLLKVKYVLGIDEAANA